MEDLIKDLGSLSMVSEAIIRDKGSLTGASMPRISAEAPWSGHSQSLRNI